CFVQAEDGIRDDLVTGVQTCAVPICQRGGAIRSTLGPLNFGAYLPGQQPATTIKIPYPGPEGYSVEYDFDASQHIYKRIMDGQQIGRASCRERRENTERAGAHEESNQ